MKIKGAFLALLCLGAAPALAAPVLVSVDLPGLETKKAWRDMGIATYRMLGNTAIAECPEDSIPALERDGFHVSIIDREPWSQEYYLVSSPVELGGWLREGSFGSGMGSNW